MADDLLTAVTKAIVWRLHDAGVGDDTTASGPHDSSLPMLTVKAEPSSPDRIISVTAYSRTAPPDPKLLNRELRVQLMIRGAESARHALGLWLLAYDTVEFCLAWFRYQPGSFFLAAARYTRFALHMRASGQARPQGRRLTHPASRLLVCVMWPVGAGLYLRDRLSPVRRAPATC